MGWILLIILLVILVWVTKCVIDFVKDGKAAKTEGRSRDAGIKKRFIISMAVVGVLLFIFILLCILIVMVMASM